MRREFRGDISVSDLSTKRVTRSMPAITYIVVAVCWFAMLADGYDLGIYGAVLPSLMEYQEWNLTPTKAGAIGSYALVGMLVGAICVGTITDMIGRKKTLAFCVSLFSIMMAFSAMANSPAMLGLWRFLGGIALGGVIPTVSALTIEYTPVQCRSLMYAVMYTGYPIGGVLGALLSMYFLEDYGWRLLFWIGAIPVLVVPFILKYLPESVSFLMTKNRREEAEILAKRYNISLDAIDVPKCEQVQEDKRRFVNVSALFSPQYIRATICFWISFFMGLLMIYGLTTWLPKLMKEAGYPLGSSLRFLMVLNLSCAIGSLLAGRLADRWGSQKIISISYFLAGLAIALLSIKSSILVVYTLLAIAGFGTIGTTLIMNAYISKYFPAENRATALGWAIGFGRIGAISGPILIGLFMSWNLELAWSFYTFAIAAVIASIMVLFIPKHPGGMV
nr:aromatic acid/H+ symport family MFS transporter [Geobacillus thermodenitrificans]